MVWAMELDGVEWVELGVSGMERVEMEGVEVEGVDVEEVEGV